VIGRSRIAFDGVQARQRCLGCGLRGGRYRGVRGRAISTTSSTVTSSRATFSSPTEAWPRYSISTKLVPQKKSVSEAVGAITTTAAMIPGYLTRPGRYAGSRGDRFLAQYFDDKGSQWKLGMLAGDGRFLRRVEVSITNPRVPDVHARW